MANICEVTEQMESSYEKWILKELDGKAKIADIARKYPPWKLFRMKSTGHRVAPYAFNNDGTITIFVSGLYNFVMFERTVFGVNPDDLEECSLPSASERVGIVITNDKEIDEYVSKLGNPKIDQRNLVKGYVEKYMKRIKSA